VRLEPRQWFESEPELEEAAFRERLQQALDAAYTEKIERVGAPLMRHIEKDVMLQTLDQHWREHLGALDYLRQGIHLRGYAQKDYRYEYKREAFELFSSMLDRVKFDTVSTLAKIEVRTQEEIDREEEARRLRLMRALQPQHQQADSVLLGSEPASAEEAVSAPPAAPSAPRAAVPFRLPGAGTPPPAAPGAAEAAPFVRGDRKVGRNEPCPCGSGKKYKHCHGALAGVE
jgi:preprotein translocase subunit SecA